MENLREIISEIKKRRKYLGISQESLSELAGVSLRSLKMLESGKANPRFESLSKIVDALGMSLYVRMKS